MITLFSLLCTHKNKNNFIFDSRGFVIQLCKYYKQKLLFIATTKHLYLTRNPLNVPLYMGQYNKIISIYCLTNKNKVKQNYSWIMIEIFIIVYDQFHKFIFDVVYFYLFLHQYYIISDLESLNIDKFNEY